MEQKEKNFFLVNLYQYNGKIPFIISDLIKKLDENNGEKSEGIFRLSGLRSEVDALCSELDNGRVEKWKDQYLDVNVLACSLKRYISSLSKFDPLITKEIEKELQAIYSQNENKIEKYKIVFSKNNEFCLTRKRSLSYILKYLNKIASNSDINKMTAKNLAIIFFLTLFPAVNNLELKVNMDILEEIIANYEMIFDPNENFSQYFMEEKDFESIQFKSSCCIIL